MPKKKPHLYGKTKRPRMYGPKNKTSPYVGDATLKGIHRILGRFRSDPGRQQPPLPKKPMPPKRKLKKRKKK